MDAVGHITDRDTGFVLLPGYLSPLEQRQLIRTTLENHAKSPNENNLDTHYILPKEGLWPAWKAFSKERMRDSGSVEPIIEPKASAGITAQPDPKRTLIENVPASVENLEDLKALEKLPAPPSNTLTSLPLSSILHKLRWSNIGHFYHWGTKSYQFNREQIPVPSDIKSICQRAVRSVPWSDVWRDIDTGDWERDYDQWNETYEPDAGIINFYQLKVTGGARM